MRCTPGTIDSNFSSHADERTQSYIRTLTRLTSEQGADTLTWLATAAEAGKSTGGYFFQRKPRTPNPHANDAVYVDRLWEESEKLVAKAGV